MNFIVFDLEATCWEGRPLSMVQETIEIGALSVSRYGEVESVFSRFVRPAVNPRLSFFCLELTTINQENIDRAEAFPQVIEDFQDWIGIFEEEYVLCSWGKFDLDLLIQDCQLHDLEDDWLDPHINLKRQYRDLKGLSRPRGLKSSVKAEGFEFTGTHHRAIDDAENLCKIFTKYLDEWQF